MDTDILPQMLPNGLKGEDLTQDQIHEILVLLLNHFGSSESMNTSAMAFPGSNSPQIQARFDNTGNLITVLSGLSPDDAERVCSHVRTALTGVGEAIGREVLFSYKPVGGYWRYRDRFQLLPVPAHAPRPEFSIAPHPFLLECTFRKTGDLFRDAVRRSREVNGLLILLNGLFHTGIRRLGNKHSWVLFPTAEGTEKLKVACLQSLYSYEGLQPQSNGFSATGGTPPVPIVPATDYYGDRLWSLSDPFVLPDNLEESLDLSFQLPPLCRNKVERACFWLSQVSEVPSQSLAFICIVQAIDALLGEVKKGTSRTQHFREFVKQFAPSPMVSDKDREDLFKVRSDLSHGLRDAFHSDRGLDLHPETMTDRNRTWFASNVARICILNWMRTPNPGK